MAMAVVCLRSDCHSCVALNHAKAVEAGFSNSIGARNNHSPTGMREQYGFKYAFPENEVG
jgi:hypothetical protein